MKMVDSKPEKSRGEKMDVNNDSISQIRAIYAKEINKFAQNLLPQNMDWKFAVTLSTNGKYDHRTVAEKQIKQFTVELNWKVFGLHRDSKDPYARIYYLLIPEYGEGNDELHFHGLMACPKKYIYALMDNIDCVWKSIFHQGSSMLVRISDASGWKYYMTTEKDFGFGEDTRYRCRTKLLSDFIHSEMMI